MNIFKCFPSVDFFIVTIFISISITNGNEPQHRTKAAAEKHHDLWCYRCDTMVDGDKCLDLSVNRTSMQIRCTKEQKKCQVRKISMSTSTDEITGSPKLWLLQRNCTETCEPGCIIIGERTKLHSCITCCDEQNFCNSGNHGNCVKEMLIKFSVFIYVLYFIKILL